MFERRVRLSKTLDQEFMNLKQLSPSEFVEQSHLVTWLNLKNIDFFAVPNGYKKGFQAQRKAKAEGLKSGIPDIIILNKAYNKQPTVVEMKRVVAKDHKVPCNCMATNQKLWADIFINQGWNHVLAHGFDDAVKQLEALGY